MIVWLKNKRLQICFKSYAVISFLTALQKNELNNKNVRI